jgi:hypothetical protein
LNPQHGFFSVSQKPGSSAMAVQQLVWIQGPCSLLQWFFVTPRLCYPVLFKG